MDSTWAIPQTTRTRWPGGLARTQRVGIDCCKQNNISYDNNIFILLYACATVVGLFCDFFRAYEVFFFCTPVPILECMTLTRYSIIALRRTFNAGQTQ